MFKLPEDSDKYYTYMINGISVRKSRKIKTTCIKYVDEMEYILETLKRNNILFITEKNNGETNKII